MYFKTYRINQVKIEKLRHGVRTKQRIRNKRKNYFRYEA